MDCFKRVGSMLLAIILIVSLCPVVAPVHAEAAEEASTVFTVESGWGMPGSEVNVDISVSGNPGILGATLTVSFDENLTLVDAAAGEAFGVLDMTKPGQYVSGCNFVFDGQEISAEEVRDGVVLTLTFQVAEGAEVNQPLAVNLSAAAEDIFDGNFNDVPFVIGSGSVLVIDYIPGDVNSDGVINAKDVAFLRRHIAGGYGDAVNTAAADVNDDGKLNAKDVALIRRNIAGGYDDGPLRPATPKCSHTMEAHAFKAANCTEDGNISYWYCTSCGKYFNSAEATTEITLASTVLGATGHTAVTDSRVEPTYTSVGWTEGSHCSTCNEVLVAPEEIPMLQPGTYNIVYELYDGDAYLESLGLENPNPASHSSIESLTLQELSASGYRFEGWYDGSGLSANRVTVIPEGTAGTVFLYARWEPYTYTITYDSELVTVPNSTYNSSTGASLPGDDVMEITGYYFMGWSNDDGVIQKTIPAGTHGNITLHANYTSKRNSTIPYDYSSQPLKVVDCSDENLYLFMYEIGRIENVPLYQIGDTTNKSGITNTETVTVTNTVQESFAEEVAEVVSNATTNSTSWTLSSDWNTTTSISETQSSSVSQETVQEAESHYASTGTYSISEGTGGKTSTTNTKGVSGKLSAGMTTEVGASATANAEAEVKATKVNPGVKVGASTTVSTKVGTSLSAEISSSTESTESNESSWNTDKGYSSSRTAGGSSSVRNALSQTVANSSEWGYNKSYGGSNSSTEGRETTSTTGRESSSTFAYNTENITSKTTTWSNESAPDGYYRWVCAGTVHVFAVVGYDLATDSYFVTTYSVMDDSTYTFVDYSKTTSGFDDYENGVLPFVVPISVKNYVDVLTACTDELSVDMSTGFVDQYTGNDDVVIIPQYKSIPNGDGTNTVVEIVGVEPGVFAGNTNLRAVYFPETVTEIPDDTFQGCASLMDVSGYFTSIGDNAFAGCSSLVDFKVPASVTHLGTNAFEGLPSVNITAANSAVVKAAVNCGADSIVLNLASMSDTLANATLTIPAGTAHFEFQGGGKTYSNVNLVSDVATTKIIRTTFTSTSGIPLTLSSSAVELNQTTVTAPGLAMLLTNDSTSLSLYGTSTVTSSSTTAVLSKAVSFTRASTEVSGKLNVTGDVLVRGVEGDATGTTLLNFTSGEVKYISDDEYEEGKENAVSLVFDANGGECSQTTGCAELNTMVGELPVPTKENHVFLGWFTDPVEGSQITADSIFTVPGSVILYARWALGEYTATWEEGTGYTITVERTESSYGAECGVISSGGTVYHGDVLAVSYAAKEGYTLGETGVESITVAADVTAAEIYASATANSYTYDIVYKSSNGTELGTSTATYDFGTTNTITPETVSGYDTPASQDVAWDSVAGKTITFTYTPTAVSTYKKTGTISSSSPKMTYSAKVEYQSRTATSVQVRVIWTTTMGAGGWTDYQQNFKATCGSVSTGNVKVADLLEWQDSSSSDRSSTGTSKWITIPLSTTNATTVSLAVYHWESNYNGTDMSAANPSQNPSLNTTLKVPIPAY